jgi:hypothetical protein
MAATSRKRQQQNRRPHKSNRIAATPDKKMKEGHAVVLAPSLHSCSERAGLISAAAVDPATNRFSGCAAEVRGRCQRRFITIRSSSQCTSG